MAREGSEAERSRRGEEEEGWIVLSRELTADLLDLADAEIGEAREEIGAVLRRAGGAVALIGGAFVLLFWVLAMVAYTLVAILSVWLPAWAAGLIVTTFFLLVAAALAGIGYLRLKKLENPFDIIMRRSQEHIAWWRNQVSLHPEGTRGRDGRKAAGKEGRHESD